MSDPSRAFLLRLGNGGIKAKVVYISMTAKVTFLTVESGASNMQERQNRLAKLIEQLLQEGWTQTTLAEAIGVDFSTVHRWLKSKTIPEPDSKNFRQLAKLSGGNSRSLQLYLDGEMSLSAYRQGLDKKLSEEVKNSKSSATERIKKEVLAKIYSLDPVDIAEVISSSVAFLARQE